LHKDKLWFAPKKAQALPDFLPRLVVESNEKRGYLIAQSHMVVGHRGRDSHYRQLLDRFYWPNMYEDVNWFVRSCIECQKSIRAKPFLKYNESWMAPYLRCFDLDCIHMPTGVGKAEYIIHAMETTMLWPEAKAVKRITSAAVADFIYKDIICRFGCVPIIRFDGGSEFKGEVRSLLQTQYQCQIVVSSPHHPEGNARIERHHQPLVDAIFKVTGDAKGSWPKYLHAALFAVRITVSRSSGYSPYFLLYGSHPVLSFDITESTWQTLDWDQVRTYEDLIAIRIKQLQRRDQRLESARRQIRESRRKAIEDRAARMGKNFDFSAFKEGMYVWLRESKLDEIKGGKGEWMYSGPYVINRKLDWDAFELAELDGAILKGHVNIRRLRLFFYRPENQTLKTALKSRPRIAVEAEPRESVLVLPSAN